MILSVVLKHGWPLNLVINYYSSLGDILYRRDRDLEGIYLDNKLNTVPIVRLILNSLPVLLTLRYNV